MRSNEPEALLIEAEAARPRASFRATTELTQDDAAILGDEFVRFAGELPDRVLAHLRLLAIGHDGFPVDRLTHSLQAATLAFDDGRDDEYVVCALLHDIGDTLGSYNHPDIAAAILRPFVSAQNLYMVEKHGVFQAYHMLRHRLGGPGGEPQGRHVGAKAAASIDVRDALRRHAYYDHAEEFSAKYDVPAFDPERRTPDLSFFEPMVRSLFARPKRSA